MPILRAGVVRLRRAWTWRGVREVSGSENSAGWLRVETIVADECV